MNTNQLIYVLMIIWFILLVLFILYKNEELKNEIKDYIDKKIKENKND